TGEDWELFKENLLDFLRDLQPREFRGEKITIFLKEGLITEAIALANDLSNYESDLLQKVMGAAMAVNPQWVINKARPFAEEIMNAGKAESYDHAVNWLKLVKKAYFAADQKLDWERYYSELRNIHQRKRKLMGLFKDL
ncbi:MAG: SWIM zinc finger family protein, partial [Microcystaceae cyanobacterium]